MSLRKITLVQTLCVCMVCHAHCCLAVSLLDVSPLKNNFELGGIMKLILLVPPLELLAYVAL